MILNILLVILHEGNAHILLHKLYICNPCKCILNIASTAKYLAAKHNYLYSPISHLIVVYIIINVVLMCENTCVKTCCLVPNLSDGLLRFRMPLCMSFWYFDPIRSSSKFHFQCAGDISWAVNVCISNELLDVFSERACIKQLIYFVYLK